MSPTEFMSAYVAAANAHDIDAVLDLIADDAVYLFSNQTAHIGKSAIRNAIQANFEAIEGEIYRIQNLRWLASSTDVAACGYEFDWSGTRNGRPVSGRGAVRPSSDVRTDGGRSRTST